jgi:hypothetical protein
MLKNLIELCFWRIFWATYFLNLHKNFILEFFYTFFKFFEDDNLEKSFKFLTSHSTSTKNSFYQKEPPRPFMLFNK